jgi:chaperonin GroES
MGADVPRSRDSFLLTSPERHRYIPSLESHVRDEHTGVRDNLNGRKRKKEIPYMKVRPLHDRLLVKRIEESEQKSDGGIIIPDTAREKPQRGKVTAVGNGKILDDGTRVELEVKTNDVVLFGKYAGTEVKIDGTEYLILREDDVLAVVGK